jgi:hypothetical protein
MRFCVITQIATERNIQTPSVTKRIIRNGAPSREARVGPAVTTKQIAALVGQANEVRSAYYIRTTVCKHEFNLIHQQRRLRTTTTKGVINFLNKMIFLNNEISGHYFEHVIFVTMEIRHFKLCIFLDCIAGILLEYFLGN